MYPTEIIVISKDELVDIAKKFHSERRRLVMMNGYVDAEGQNVVAYNFDFDGHLKTYQVKGEKVVPSLVPVYKGTVQWCEEEICELKEKADKHIKQEDFDKLCSKIEDAEKELIKLKLNVKEIAVRNGLIYGAIVAIILMILKELFQHFILG